jgi:hypothetical protein
MPSPPQSPVVAGSGGAARRTGMSTVATIVGAGSSVAL